MKALFSIILSLLIFTASFQNSLFIIDYKMNRAYYEIHCMNKNKPEMDCHGKCQMKMESEKSSNPISQVKYTFEFNILPAKTLNFDLKKVEFISFKNEIHTIYLKDIRAGYSKIFPHPPQFYFSLPA